MDKHPARNADGFLLHPADWDDNVAIMLARESGILLTEAHWEILRLARQYHSEFGTAPGSKLLVRYVRRECGDTKGNSIYLMKLFGGRAARTISLIAGLPKPEHCL